MKLGEAGCLLPEGTVLPPTLALRPRDTSGAGDAFDAAYLAARMDGRTPCEAAAQGHRLAAWTIMRAGAIPERDDKDPYAKLRAMRLQSPPA